MIAFRFLGRVGKKKSAGFLSIKIEQQEPFVTVPPGFVSVHPARWLLLSAFIMSCGPLVTSVLVCMHWCVSLMLGMFTGQEGI